jgi:TrbL/VirB6 plasmid conjugal transfer protein
VIVLGCSWAPWDWDDCIKKFLGEALESTIGSLFKLIFDAIKSVVIDAVEAVMKAVGTLWIDIDTPDVTNNNAVSFIQDRTLWILIFAATISVIIAGVRMAISQRGEPVRDILRSLITMVVVAGLGVALSNTLISIADSFSEWIVDEAIGGSSFSTRIGEILVDPLKDGGVGLMLVIVIGILMVIASLVQLALMVVRYGMLILLVGVLPLTAAATNTEAGMTWFKRAVAWLAGFILYKPVAAIIWAAAIKLIGTPEGAPDATLAVITGVTMMLLAIVALPAILRFVSPRTGG